MLAHLYIEEQGQDNWSVYDYYVRSERNATEFARFIGWVEGGGGWRHLNRGWAHVSHCPHVVRKRQNNGRYLQQQYTGVAA